MPISWDPTMDRKLLVAILKHHNISVDAVAVAKELATEAQPCTALAITKRLQKIRAMIKTESNGETDSPTKSKATPRKRAKAGNGIEDGEDDETPTKTAKTSRAGRGKTTIAGAEEDDEEEAEEKVRVKEEGYGDVDWA